VASEVDPVEFYEIDVAEEARRVGLLWSIQQKY
jgi:hypothetical protein